MQRSVEGSYSSEGGSHSHLEAVSTQPTNTRSSRKKNGMERTFVPFEDTESQAISERFFIHRRVLVELSFSYEDSL